MLKDTFDLKIKEIADLLATTDGRVGRFRSYGFCRETVREIAGRTGLSMRKGVYRAPTPAPGQDW